MQVLPYLTWHWLQNKVCFQSFICDSMLHFNLWFIFPLRIHPAIFWVNSKYVLGTVINCYFRWKVTLAGGMWLNILIGQQTYQQTHGKKKRKWFCSLSLCFRVFYYWGQMSVKDFWSPNLTLNNLKGSCNAHCIGPYKQPRILPAHVSLSSSISPRRLKGF